MRMDFYFLLFTSNNLFYNLKHFFILFDINDDEKLLNIIFFFYS